MSSFGVWLGGKLSMRSWSPLIELRARSRASAATAIASDRTSLEQMSMIGPAAAAPAFAQLSALAFDRALHPAIVAALERKRIVDADVPRPEARLGRPVDLLELFLDERVIGGEVDLGTGRDAGERHAVRAIQPAQELSRRLDRPSAASGCNARAIDHDHDQPSADRLGVRRVLCRRRGCAGRRAIGSRRDADELHGHNRPRPAVDAQFEVVGRQIANGAALRVDRADIHLNDVDRRLEALGRWRCLGGQRQGDDERPEEETHEANSTARTASLSRLRLRPCGSASLARIS